MSYSSLPIFPTPGRRYSKSGKRLSQFIYLLLHIHRHISFLAALFTYKFLKNAFMGPFHEFPKASRTNYYWFIFHVMSKKLLWVVNPISYICLTRPQISACVLNSSVPGTPDITIRLKRDADSIWDLNQILPLKNV